MSLFAVNNDIINKDKVGEFVVDHSLYTEGQSTISSTPVSNTIINTMPNNMVGTMNTNNAVTPSNNIPNIYASAPSTPSSINVTSINNNQNIS